MTYTPDHRTPLLHAFAPQRWHRDDSPRCFVPDWENEETADAYLTTVFERLSQTDRAIVTMPMGKLPGWFSSAQWHTGETWRQRLLLERINDWLRGGYNRTFELLIGCRPARWPHHLSMNGSYAPDPDDHRALGSFVATVLPWVTGTKLHRLWLDHAATNFNYSHVVKLAEWCKREWGLIIGTEAYRTTPVQGEWILDEEALLRMPGYAHSTYIMHRDDDREWICPPDAEAIAVMRRPDNPTQELVDSLRERGFVVGSISPECDGMVL